LTHVPEEGQTIGGFGRNDFFAYEQRFASTGTIVPRVRTEAGTASGREPTEEVQLHSYIGQFLNATGASVGASDEQPFGMRLLHYRRTFVEKMFAIHSKIELFKKHGVALGSYARHYYDLYQLAQQDAVHMMLQSEEYGRIKADYEQISLQAFPRSYFRPEGMSFAGSDALFPTADLRAMIASEYEAQCKALCFGPYPSWEEVEAVFASLRSQL
jgi:hypothetical protein